MFYFLSLFTGIIIAVMIAVNGALVGFYSLHLATVIIHIVGLTLISLVVFARRERPFTKMYSWFLYLGGAIGVFTVVANNIAFGRISVSALLALGLLGQIVSGLIIDQYGLFGMQKHPINARKLVGLGLIVGGIAAMVNSFEILAVIVSFGAGVTIVTSRTVNAKLADLTNVYISTFYNYVVGLMVAIPVFLLLGRGGFNLADFSISPDWYIYLGGILGVSVVFICNITVVKISALYLTLFIFVGQVFAGILIDLMFGEFSARIFVGGLFVTAGLIWNFVMDKKFAT